MSVAALLFLCSEYKEIERCWPVGKLSERGRKVLSWVWLVVTGILLLLTLSPFRLTLFLFLLALVIPPAYYLNSERLRRAQARRVEFAAQLAPFASHGPSVDLDTYGLSHPAAAPSPRRWWPAVLASVTLLFLGGVSLRSPQPVPTAASRVSTPVTTTAPPSSPVTSTEVVEPTTTAPPPPALAAEVLPTTDAPVPTTTPAPTTKVTPATTAAKVAPPPPAPVIDPAFIEAARQNAAAVIARVQAAIAALMHQSRHTGPRR